MIGIKPEFNERMIQKINPDKILLKKFARGYYREFHLPQWFNGSEELTEILQQVWNRSDSDLYDRGGEDDLEAAIEEVLKTLGLPNNEITHKTYVYMAWTMALAAQPTIKHYCPNDRIFRCVKKQIILVSDYLKNQSSNLKSK